MSPYLRISRLPRLHPCEDQPCEEQARIGVEQVIDGQKQWRKLCRFHLDHHIIPALDSLEREMEMPRYDPMLDSDFIPLPGGPVPAERSRRAARATE